MKLKFLCVLSFCAFFTGAFILSQGLFSAQALSPVTHFSKKQIQTIPKWCQFPNVNPGSAETTISLDNFFYFLMMSYAEKKGYGTNLKDPYLGILEEWRDQKQVVVDVACGAGVVVQYLRSCGIQAYGIDPEISKKTQEKFPYLLKGKAQDMAQILRTQGIEKVDVFISISFLNADFAQSGNWGLSETELLPIAKQFKALSKKETLFLFRTDHTPFAMTNSASTLRHFAELLKVLREGGDIEIEALKIDGQFWQGAGLYLGKVASSLPEEKPLKDDTAEILKLYGAASWKEFLKLAEFPQPSAIETSL